jgi:membrane protein involved in colicin uptake
LDENVRIVLRVSFNRDGTLASQPWILNASFLPGASALIQAAMSALEKCRPYAELPKDKYNEWKTLNLVVTPRTLSGG